MKIAILGPSPVPFTIGGVENLLWKLCETINQKTIHQAELIKLPSREDNFWNIIENYYNFYKLNLNYFDLVITTKYPAWMIRHSNHICYMCHRLRGLYDTYHFTKLSIDVKYSCKPIDNILEYMKNNNHPNNLDEFFNLLFKLKKEQNKVDDSYFNFPGPFIRKIVHYMDDYGLSKKNITKFYSISEIVKKRERYFPQNIDIKVIYPPSALNYFSCKDYKYIFMVSRLDGPKRIDMLIKAMKHVKSNIDLLIAGTGPQEQELKKLAKNDNRIKFLGFVNDEDIEKYYANSLVIPYFPYDEDYGLITIEAMMHKKPVITTFDSGGPTEFVINNQTGFITDFDEKAIGEKIEFFAKNPSEAKRMGENAYNKVKDITWENTIKHLLSNIEKNNNLNYLKNQKQRKNIVVTSTFPIYPPQGGGQARIFNLYKSLAKKYDINIISFTNSNESSYTGYIATNLKEIRIPKSEKHQQAEWDIERKAGIPVGDISMITLSHLTPEYGQILKKHIDKSDFVIVSHPYLYNEVKKYITDQIIIYEAHNVESKMKEDMLPESKYKKTLLKSVFDIEKECCKNSNLIMTCSKEDQLTLNDIYDVSVNNMITVPNGVDCLENHFTSIKSRITNKQTLGIENEKIGIFMGSWHQPNLEACEEIFKIAKQCQNVKFLLIGSQCLYFKNYKHIPKNVGMVGLISEKEKNKIFASVDFALNPMISGSGTNLKMFDYMAAGIPIITTKFGARGIDRQDLLTISSIDDMAKYIKNFNLAHHEDAVSNCRKYVEGNFDWKVISEILIKKMEEFDK